MEQEYPENPIIGAFYVAALGIAFLCLKPKLAFYLTIILSVMTSALLFRLQMPVEMGGLVHTGPFAVVVWMISEFRRRRRQKGSSALDAKKPT